MATAPDDRRYSKSHEWHKPEGDLVVIGISQFAVDELADITFLEITATEGELKQGDPFGEIESVKATSELYAGIDGEVVEVNQAVLEDPSIINEDPYEKGWMIKVRPTDKSQLDGLLSAADYEAAAGG
ncbi:MAG: glycine cleavage system protein GcvH [Phycisphaeraceae bacterium]